MAATTDLKFVDSLGPKEARRLAHISAADSWFAPGLDDRPKVSAQAVDNATIEHLANLVMLNLGSAAEIAAGINIRGTGVDFLIGFHDETNHQMTQIALTDTVAEWLMRSLSRGLSLHRGVSPMDLAPNEEG